MRPVKYILMVTKVVSKFTYQDFIGAYLSSVEWLHKDAIVYVSDMVNSKIKKVTPSGIVSTLAGSTQGDGERFSEPKGIAIDKDGNIYVSDTSNRKIKKIQRE